jgi:hypothetical protein
MDPIPSIKDKGSKTTTLETRETKNLQTAENIRIRNQNLQSQEPNQPKADQARRSHEIPIVCAKNPAASNR